MNTRRIGTASVAEIGLGCMCLSHAYGVPPAPRDAQRVLHRAIELGITTFDASVGGIGGSPFAKMAAGNLATEDLVWMCNGLGIETGLHIERLAATSAWMSQQLGRELPGRVARALTSGNG